MNGFSVSNSSPAIDIFGISLYSIVHASLYVAVTGHRHLAVYRCWMASVLLLECRFGRRLYFR